MEQRISVYVLDDEPKSLFNLVKIFKIYFQDQVEVVGFESDPYLALDEVTKLKPDVLFLDIEMPAINGLQLVERLEDKNIEIVYVTAYEQYALQAYKRKAMAYLLKPIDLPELKEVVLKIKKIVHPQIGSAHQEIREKYEKNEKKEKLTKIIIPSKNGQTLLDFDEVLYLEADGNYTLVHITNGQKLISTKNLGEYESMLYSSDFFRIHHRYLINVSHLKKYVSGRGGNVILESNIELEVSSRKKGVFLEFLKNRSL